MKTLAFVFVFFIYGRFVVNGTDPQTLPVNLTGVTLDIKAPDNTKIETYNPKLHCIETPIYTAKNGYYIEKVVDEATVLCYPPKDAFVKVTHCYRDKWFDILHVYIVESDDNKSSQYFLKKDGQWNEVVEEVFYDHFNALSHTEHSFYEETFLLVDKRDPWRLYINESIKSPFVVYGPKTTCRVIEIKTKKDDNTSIWKRKKDEWCTKITLYPKTGDYKLMWIVTKDPYEKEEILYYSKVSGSWKSVNKDAYLEDLKKSGFKESTFNDRVTLDISKYDKDLFFKVDYQVDIVTMDRYHVLPGFRISKVVQGDSLIWESKEDDKFATYFRLNTRGSKVSLGALFTTNTRKEHKIIYHAKDASGSWKVIDKSIYYDILAGRNSPIYIHDIKPKIVMSSFRNKKDLKVVSYAFTVEDAKADIILIHGVRGSVLSDYGTFNMDWCYEFYGFDAFPHISIFDDSVEDVKKVSNVDRYRQYFEYKTLEGMNPYDILHRSQYEGTFLEALNRLGYNVYSYDNQSNGFSEAETEKRCHVEDYVDYVNDVLQFVNIIRRGKFSDVSQVWNESTVFASHPYARKLILLGYSLGGNMVVRALETFYEKLKDSNAKFVNALIGLSTMLDLDYYLPETGAWLVIQYFKFGAWRDPRTDGYYQKPSDIGTNFEAFSDYHNDLLYYNKIITRRTTVDYFLASRDARDEKKTKVIPGDLPIFLVHTTNDTICDVKGPRMVMDHIGNTNTANLLEFSGDGHHSVATQLVPLTIPQLNNWLNERIPDLEVLKKDSIKLDVGSVDESLFATQESFDGGIHTKKLSPKDGRLTEVYEGQEAIWKAYASKEHCLSTLLHYYDKKPLLVTVRYAKDDSTTAARCYIKQDGTWKWVDKKDFDTLLANIKSDPFLLKPSVKLDISSVDTNLFSITDPSDGFSIKALAPKDGYRLTAVSDDQEAIWKTYSHREYCKSVRTYYDGEKPVSATVTFVKGDGTTEFVYYVKRDGKWAVVEKTDHDEKLATMKRATTLLKLGVKLNVAEVDGSVFDIQESSDGCIPLKKLSPKSGYRLTEVRGGQESIWRAYGKGEHCLSTWIHYYLKFPVLVTVQFSKGDDKNDFRYYVRQADGTWKWVEKVNYDAALTKMKKDVTSLQLKATKLDICSVDATLFTLTDSTEEGVPLKKLYPKDDHRLTEVKDGQETIWEATNYTEFGNSVWLYYEGSSPLLAVVRLVKSDGTNVLQYYDKKRGKWTQVTKEDHETALTSMKRGFSLSRLNVKLDVASADKNLFTIQDSSEDGVATKTFTPEKTYRLTEVSDGQEAIWKAYSSKQHCLSALAYYDATGGPILATVTFVKADRTTVSRCYIKQDGTWKWVDKEDFDTALTKMKKDLILSKIRAKLDVSSIDESLFIIHDSLNEDVLLKTITPKGDHRLVEVSEGNLSIWKGEEDEYSKSAWFHYDTAGLPTLATVQFVKGDGNTAFRCYVKQNNGTWKWVNKTVHDEKLAGMKKAASLAKVKDKLDLTNIYGSLFDIKYFFDGEVPIRHITPRTGHTITEVSNGQEAIWKIETDNEHCKSAWVYYDVNTPLLVTVQFVKEDGTNVLRCYVKGEDKWNWAKKDDFDNALAKMRRDASLAKEKARLDINSIDKTLFAITESKDGNVSIRTLTPNKNYRVTEVTDGEEAIWKAYASKEHCKSVWLHCVEEKPLLATIRYSKNDGRTPWRYYVKKDDGTWAWVNKNVHDEKLEELKKEPPESPQNDVPEEVLQEEDLQVTQKELRDVEVDEVIQEVDLEDSGSPEVTTPAPPSEQHVLLDLSSPDTTKIDVKGGQPGGFQHYYPKDGFTISHVIDSTKVFWKLVEGEKCDLVKSNEKNGSIFLSITISKDGVPTSKCFVKVGSTWTELTEGEYYQKLSEQSSQPSSRSPSLKGSTENLASSSTSLNG